MSDVRRVPPHAVDRPALRAQLDLGNAAPLTLVVAPAGSGKTVLLSQWVESRDDIGVAWLDVAPADDDALVFSRRLIGVISDIDPRLARMDAPVGNPAGGLGDPFIEALAAELADLPQLVVVFDDLHHIAGSAIVADLWRLTDMLPSNAHFVFSSRFDLKIGLSRYRLEHGIVELRQTHLAFDDEVTARVLERITGSRVSGSTAASITRHTEGWAAGVQLSALSLRSHTDPDRFIDDLGETDRLIIDYLSEEVFDAQPRDRRDALLRLSVLDEVSAGLVEAVAGVADGDAFLRALEQESMFVVAVPGQWGRYRFHHLFRDLLRYRLRAVDADAEARLLTVAAEWHLAHDGFEESVEYLLRAKQWAAAAELLLASGRDVYEGWRTTTLARWLSLIPAEFRLAHPQLQLLYGISSGMSGRGAVAVDAMTGLLADDLLDIGERQVALAYLAVCVQFQPHPDVFLDYGKQALQLLAAHPDVIPPDLMHLTQRPILEAVSMTAIGRAQFFAGDLDDARLCMEMVLAGPGSAYGPYRVHALGTLALIEAWSGRLKVATDIADEALDIATNLSLLSHPAPADAYLARAIVAIQRGEPEVGAFSLHEGNVRASANQRTQLMWIAHLASSMIDPDNTDPTIVEPPGPPPPIVARRLLAAEWRRARLAGEPLSPGRRAETEWSTLAFEHLAALLERGAVADARALLTRIDFVADEGAPSATVEYGMMLAWLAAAEGRTTESRAHLVAALEFAEGEWLLYPFTRAGPRIATLVDALPGQATAFRRLVVRRGSARSAAAIDQLAEPLTSRELELLAYLPSRLTNTELAARCYVSVNTIKTHMAHIYRKLDATGRDAAIARARQLGLLPHPEITHVG